MSESSKKRSKTKTLGNSTLFLINTYLYVWQREMKIHLLARCLPDSNKEIFSMSLPKQSACCHFWPIKSHILSHVVIWVAFILLGIYFFYHSFCLHDFKILVTLVKSRQRKGVPLHVLALFVLLLTFSRTRSISFY